MAIAFDDVIPRLLEVGTANPVLTRAKHIAVVRDPIGRVRIALEAPSATDADRSALETALTTALAGWYAGPALYPDGGPPQKRIALDVLARAGKKWPVGWPRESMHPLSG